MTCVEILLFDGFDELDAVTPYEVLAPGGAAGLNVEVAMVTLDRPREVTAAHGLRVTAGAALGEHPDVVVVPGGRWARRHARSAWTEAQRGVLPAALAERHEGGSVLAAVCKGKCCSGKCCSRPPGYSVAAPRRLIRAPSLGAPSQNYGAVRERLHPASRGRVLACVAPPRAAAPPRWLTRSPLCWTTSVAGRSRRAGRERAMADAPAR